MARAQKKKECGDYKIDGVRIRSIEIERTWPRPTCFDSIGAMMMGMAHSLMPRCCAICITGFWIL
jgi:hypothetical protein